MDVFGFFAAVPDLVYGIALAIAVLAVTTLAYIIVNNVLQSTTASSYVAASVFALLNFLIFGYHIIRERREAQK